MAGKCLSQPRWQRVVKEMEAIGQGAQVLDLGEKLCSTLIRRRWAIDVGKGQGVTIQVGNALACPLVDPKDRQQESGQAKQYAQNCQESASGFAFNRRDVVL
jgi:hypothetical protein